MSGFLSELDARGMVHNVSAGLGTRLTRGGITGYVGFDPTADSLHVGNLVPVMALAWLQRLGGRPIVVVGGGTGMVGDPSGKRAERPMLTVEEIDANAAAVHTQLGQFLDFSGPRAARMFNNADWLRDLRLMEFLRETGKHFTLGYMLQKESVRSRLETGISFTEFAYMLVQAYDYDHLYRTEGCELQMGGSDQWGNITAGIELVARRHRAEVHGLTLPLLTTAAGGKFGKSEDDNVWLDSARTSPYRFYQFWINQDDRDLPALLRLFTFRSLDEVSATVTAHEADPGRREGQRALAEELTRRVHGDEATRRAAAASRILFGGQDVREADAATLETVAAEVPAASVPEAELRGMTVVDALVRVGLAPSKAEARRGIQGGGFSLNGERVVADRRLGMTDALAARYLVLQRGRRTYAVLIVQS
jgi:tyrosyl-tRNA synthetase